ncbi:hypothetical protein ACXU4B_02855 [Dyella soli]
MPHKAEDPQRRMMHAFDELVHLYRLLERENDMLREQLRRHSAGELQIRETERRMSDLRGHRPQVTHDRLRELLTSDSF